MLTIIAMVWAIVAFSKDKKIETALLGCLVIIAMTGMDFAWVLIGNVIYYTWFFNF